MQFTFQTTEEGSWTGTTCGGRLPLIREAVGSDYPLLFDSGIRNGESVVKALALGADFVMLGRPFLFASGANGERGVMRLVELLRDEVSLTLAQLGCESVEKLERNMIIENQKI
ncbi:MAG: hypothetical protein Ct9H300mP28_19580 [Pseudomonadota bacterium]|nr:MAG: hypothetical protein Ct9H300mP28_19580 [Pseudomonadota bacterium]